MGNDDVDAGRRSGQSLEGVDAGNRGIRPSASRLDKNEEEKKMDGPSGLREGSSQAGEGGDGGSGSGRHWSWPTWDPIGRGRWRSEASLCSEAGPLVDGGEMGRETLEESA